MKKVFKLATIRKLEQQVSLGKISHSRMVEILNEMAFKAYNDNSNDSKESEVREYKFCDECQQVTLHINGYCNIM
jgi:hypothetical protein